MGAHDRRRGASASTWPPVHARKDKIVTGLTKGVEFLFKKNKIDWIKGDRAAHRQTGTSRSTGEQAADAARDEGDHRRHRARAAAACPGIDVDRKRIITSDEAIHLKEVPKSIAILGSGAVGVEFASIFRSFGSEVTIIELLPRLVPVEDEAVSAELEKRFRKRGITVHTGTKVTSAQRRRPTALTSRCSCRTARSSEPRPTSCWSRPGAARSPRGSAPTRPASSSTAATSWSTSCSGRTCRHFGHRRRDHDGRAGPSQLAHVSSAEGIAVAERIAGQTPRALNYDHVPACTYCDPEIGSVGLTEARPGNGATTCASARSRSGARAREDGRRDRRVREDRGREEVRRGARRPHHRRRAPRSWSPRRRSRCGLECTVEELVRTIHAHPTMSEAVGEAAHAAHGAAIHI